MIIKSQFCLEKANNPNYITMLCECENFFDHEITLKEGGYIIVCKYGNDYVAYIVDNRLESFKYCRENGIQYARIVTTGEKISDFIGCTNDYICTRDMCKNFDFHTEGEIHRLDTSYLAMAEAFAKENQSYIPENNYGRLNNMIQFSSDEIYVYVHNNVLIGYCVLQSLPQYNTIVIPEIYIDRRYRNQKYGKHLLSRLTQYVLQKKEYVLYTGVDIENTASMQLACSVGYSLLTSTYSVSV